MNRQTLRPAVAVLALLGAALSQSALAQTAIYKGASCDSAGMRELILQQVNAVRARGATCGGQRYQPARPVAWNEQLGGAASGHSRDMAENNYFSHASLRGTQAAQRVEAQGYRWLSVGENIAAGENFSAANVVAGWMASPSHCSNIMDAEYTELAVSCVTRPGTTYGKYWTMVLGRR